VKRQSRNLQTELGCRHYKALFSRPNQSRSLSCPVVGRTDEQNILSSVCSEAVWVCWLVHTESVADRSKLRVQRLQACVVHITDYCSRCWRLGANKSPWTETTAASADCWRRPTGPKCTILSYRMVLLCASTCMVLHYSLTILYAAFVVKLSVT